MSKGNLSRKENQGTPRLSFEAYNISRERYLELRNGCVTGKYSLELLSKACTGFEWIEPWILLSVTKGKSYDEMRKKWDLKEIGRIPYCRTDFYGIRRYFYHRLDLLLKEEDNIHEGI